MSEEIGDGVDGELNLQSLNEGPTLEDNTADQAAVSFRMTPSRKMLIQNTSLTPAMYNLGRLRSNYTMTVLVKQVAALFHLIQLPNQCP